jgi:hypothetical protein
LVDSSSINDEQVQVNVINFMAMVLSNIYDVTLEFMNGNFYDIICTLIQKQDHYENYNFNTLEHVASEHYAYSVVIYNENF